MVSLPPVSKYVLRTNYPPTSNVAAAAQASLAKGSDRLQALDEEISRLRNLSNTRSLQKQELITFVDSHRTLVSPFNLLPPDILQEIFYHCLPTAHNAVLSYKEAPLSLGRVCSRWKQIAYSTPKLWTMIHIAVPPAVNAAPPAASRRELAMMDAISSWLSRSGVLPLSISISSADPAPNRPIQPYIDIISPHAHRWAFIQLILCDFDWINLLTQFHSTDVPRLESLHIEDHREPGLVGGWDLREGGVTALSQDRGILQAPRIRSLGLPGYIAYRLGSPIQWQHIMRLDLKGSVFQHEKFTQIASQCHSLAECTVQLNWQYWPPNLWGAPLPPPSPPAPSQLVLQNLQKFTIIADTAKDDITCEMLDGISAPNLVHFAYERAALDGWDGAPIRSIGEERLMRCLSAFFGRLETPLEELDLWMYPVAKSVLLGILEQVPGVRVLSLAGSLLSPLPQSGPSRRRIRVSHPSSSHPLDDSVLRRFIPRTRTNSRDHVAEPSLSDRDLEVPTPTCLCPSLEIISLPTTQFSQETMLEFLRSRTVLHHQNSVARLRRASIILPPAFEPRLKLPNEAEVPDMENQLMALEKATGLQVYLEVSQACDPPMNPSDTPLPIWRPYPYDGVPSTNDMSFQPFFS